MRLTLKLGTAFLFGLIVTLAVYGWATERREIDQFWNDMRRDNLLTGRFIAAAIAQLGARPTSEAVLRLLKQIGDLESPVRVRWISLNSPSANKGLLSPDQRDAVTKRNQVISISSTGGPRGDELLTYVPLALADEQGAIEVAEPLIEVQKYVRETVLRIATMTGAVIVVCSTLFLLIGTHLVGRPVNQLVEGFRHVARGDLAHRPSVSQRDELGQLAREFGALCDRLSEARQRAADEAAKRMEALEQLRHADRLRSVGQLTAGVAHELGTPLNVVWARASMIARSEVSGGDAVECARIIEEQSQRMTAIIRKLLEFARPRPPQKVRADLLRIVQQTFDVLGATARKHGVVLVTEPDATSVWGEVDAGQIQQVLSNLVLNAIQAMSHGGQVTVGVRTERACPPADVGGLVAEFLCVSVRDQGPGIAEADRPRIFEPFFTTKDVGEGTGLGLSISRGIIQEHGGWIGVTSRADEGACFTIYLPRGPSSARTHPDR